MPELEDRLDLKRVVDGYIAGVSLETDNLAFTAVDLYLWARGLAGESLSDGAGQRPRYSLRCAFLFFFSRRRSTAVPSKRMTMVLSTVGFFMNDRGHCFKNKRR